MVATEICLREKVASDRPLSEFGLELRISDDGRGIDVDAVRAKAAASGIDTEGLTGQGYPNDVLNYRSTVPLLASQAACAAASCW